MAIQIYIYIIVSKAVSRLGVLKNQPEDQDVNPHLENWPIVEPGNEELENEQDD